MEFSVAGCHDMIATSILVVGLMVGEDGHKN